MRTSARTILALACFIVFNLALAQTTLRYFSFTTGTDHVAALESLIEAFEAENPDISVEYTTAPFDGYFTRLQTDFAAGNPPDVFELNYENFVTFAARDTLLGLGEYLDPVEVERTFYPAALEAFQFEGEQYGLPITFSTVALFYNRDLFAAAGVEYPNDEWTWQDVIDAGKAITDSDQRIWGIYQPVQFWEFYKVAEQAGGGLGVNPVRVDTPENRQALSYLVDKIHVHDIMPSDAHMSGVSDVDLFVSGQLGMLVTGIWMFDRFISDAQFEWDIAVEPGGQQKATHFFSNAAVIAAQTAHPEAAMRWVEFLAADPLTAETRIAASWELPALSLEQADILEGYLAQPVPANRAAVFESLRYAVTPPVVENQPQLQDIINQELEAARLGSKTVEQALTDAQRRVEALERQ